MPIPKQRAHPVDRTRITFVPPIDSFEQTRDVIKELEHNLPEIVKQQIKRCEVEPAGAPNVTIVEGGGTIQEPKQVGPFIRTFLVYDCLTTPNAGPNVTTFGPDIGQGGVVRRVTGTPRVELTDDLGVSFDVIDPAGGAAHAIGTFVIPAGSETAQAISWTGTGTGSNVIMYDTLPDLGVIMPHIDIGSTQEDPYGVAAFTIEWVSRGASQPTGEGIAYQGTYLGTSTYSQNDIVFYNGDTYISLTNNNSNQTPATNPDDWGLIATGGADGQGVPTGGTNGQFLVKQSSTDYDTTWEDVNGVIGARIVNSSGNTITTGVKMYNQIPFDCTIIGWSAIAKELSGSISIDVCAQSNSAPPSDPVLPDTTTDKISASAPIALSSERTSSGGTSEVSTWSTSRSAWDVISLNVTSITGISDIDVKIYYKRRT